MALLNFRTGATVIFLVIVFLSFAVSSHAEKVTFVKEYTYQASELDSKHSCRTIALEMVKRLLLEELGTYLISETEVKDLKLTKDQVTTYSAGIVGAEIIDEKWDGKTFWLKARVSADPKEVAKSLKKIMEDKFKGKELEETRKKAEELTKEVERLNKELAKATNKQPSKKVQKEYKAAIQGLTAVEWFNKGYQHGLNKEYDKAIEAYTMVIALNPNNANAYLYRGHVYYEKGQYDKAIEDYSKAIALVPLQWGDDSSVFLRSYYCFRGDAYAKKGQYDRAIKDFNKAIELDPDNSFAFFIRGRAYAMKGQYDRAIEDYSKAMTFGPSYAHAKAYYERGIAYAGKGQYDKAIEDYNKVIAIDPKLAEDYKKRENAYGKKGQYDKAIKDFNKAIEENNRAIIADYNKAIALNPNDAKAYINRGNAYAMKGQYDKAIKDYNKAIELENELENTIVWSGLPDKGPTEKHNNAEYIVRLERVNHVLAHAYLCRGDAYAEKGQYDRAIEDYNKAIELENTIIYTGEIITDFQPIEEANDTNHVLAYAYTGRGVAYAKKVQYERAIEDYNKAIALAPNNASAYLGRGAAYYLSGNKDRAISDFQKACDMGNEKACNLKEIAKKYL